MSEVTQEDKRVAEDCVSAWDETRNGFNPCGDRDAGAEIVARHRTTALAAKEAESLELRKQRDSAHAAMQKLAEGIAAMEAEKAELRAEVERLRGALAELIEHCHASEKELTEEHYGTHYSGESLPLVNARAALGSGRHG